MTKIKSYLGISLLFAFTLLALTNLFQSAPIDKQEAIELIKTIEAHQHSPGGKHNIAELKEFLLTDDGKPFYTVNLYKYHETADYQESTMPKITGEQAYKLFSDEMIKLMLANFAYPVFASTWLNYSDKSWDRIVIVRYPNRRALATIFADERFSIASKHKWASIAQHDRFIVQAIHFPEFSILALLVFALVTLSVLLFKRLSNKN